MEALDDELLRETWQIGIDVCEPLQLAGLSSEAALQQICAAVRQELRLGRFPVVLGGEHTVTVPAVAACASQFADLHVVQIDAHLDLRESYHGSSLSHACVMRRLHDLGMPFTQVGSMARSILPWMWTVSTPRSCRPPVPRSPTVYPGIRLPRFSGPWQRGTRLSAWMWLNWPPVLGRTMRFLQPLKSFIAPWGIFSKIPPCARTGAEP